MGSASGGGQFDVDMAVRALGSLSERAAGLSPAPGLPAATVHRFAAASESGPPRADLPQPVEAAHAPDAANGHANGASPAPAEDGHRLLAHGVDDRTAAIDSTVLPATVAAPPSAQPDEPETDAATSHLNGSAVEMVPAVPTDSAAPVTAADEPAPTNAAVREEALSAVMPAAPEMPEAAPAEPAAPAPEVAAAVAPAIPFSSATPEARPAHPGESPVAVADGADMAATAAAPGAIVAPVEMVSAAPDPAPPAPTAAPPAPVHSAPEAAAGTRHDQAAHAMPDAPPGVRARLAPFAGILIGGAAGAALATAAILVLLPHVIPSVDLRVAPVVDRVMKLELKMEQVNREVGQLSNEMAQSIDSGTDISTRMAAQDTALAAIQKRLDQSGRAAQASVDPSLLAVAVAQLRAAFYSGRPFESEIINVYTITRGDDRLTALLQGLSAPARVGVPSAPVLRQQLRSYAAAAGLRIGAPRGFYEYGMSLINEYTGYSGEPYAVEIGSTAVTEADQRLAEGDVAGAVESLAALDPSVAGPMQPWLDSARGYVRQEAAVTDLTKAVIESLRDRMGNVGSG